MASGHANHYTPVTDPVVKDDVGQAPSGDLSPIVKTLAAIGYCEEMKSLEPIPADPCLAPRLLNLGMDFQPQATEDEKGRLDIEAFAPYLAVKQRIDVSRGLKVDRDFPLAFGPAETVQRMGPANIGTDALGLLQGLKIQQMACENARLQMQWDPQVDPQEIIAATEAEEARLNQRLQQIRERRKNQLEDKIQLIESNYQELQSNGVPSWKLDAVPEYRELFDLRKELARLNGLLADDCES